MTKLESLEQIARGATPLFEVGALKTEADYFFINTFQPALILKMINELKAARAMRDAACSLVDSMILFDAIEAYNEARNETDSI